MADGWTQVAFPEVAALPCGDPGRGDQSGNARWADPGGVAREGGAGWVDRGRVAVLENGGASGRIGKCLVSSPWQEPFGGGNHEKYLGIHLWGQNRIVFVLPSRLQKRSFICRQVRGPCLSKALSIGCNSFSDLLTFPLESFTNTRNYRLGENRINLSQLQSITLGLLFSFEVLDKLPNSVESCLDPLKLLFLPVP